MSRMMDWGTEGAIGFEQQAGAGMVTHTNTVKFERLGPGDVQVSFASEWAVASCSQLSEGVVMLSAQDVADLVGTLRPASDSGLNLDHLEARSKRGDYITKAEQMELIALARRAAPVSAPIAGDALVEPDNLPRWIDNLKGSDLTIDSLIEFIIEQRAALANQPAPTAAPLPKRADLLAATKASPKEFAETVRAVLSSGGASILPPGDACALLWHALKLIETAAPLVKYERNPRHENGSLMGWMPLDVDSDEEAAARMGHGALGEWRRASQPSEAAPLDALDDNDREKLVSAIQKLSELATGTIDGMGKDHLFKPGQPKKATMADVKRILPFIIGGLRAVVGKIDTAPSLPAAAPAAGDELSDVISLLREIEDCPGDGEPHVIAGKARLILESFAHQPAQEQPSEAAPTVPAIDFDEWFNVHSDGVQLRSDKSLEEFRQLFAQQPAPSNETDR